MRRRDGRGLGVGEGRRGSLVKRLDERWEGIWRRGMRVREAGGS